MHTLVQSFFFQHRSKRSADASPPSVQPSYSVPAPSSPAYGESEKKADSYGGNNHYTEKYAQPKRHRFPPSNPR